MKSLIGILGSFILAIGGAIMFDFLYKLTTTSFQNVQSPDSFAAFLGFISFLFIGLGLLFIAQNGRKD